MNQRMTRFALAAGLLFALCALLLPVSMGGGRVTDVSVAAETAPEGLIITTHGSHWYHFEDRWRYPAFEAFADQLEVVTTVPLDQLLEQYPDVQLEDDERRWFTYTLDSALPDSLVFDLRGSSSNFSGLHLNMYVYEPTGPNYMHFDRTYARSFHLDQPVGGEYRVQLRASRESTCTLQIGAGQSPFLTAPLDSYSFLIVPDIDSLSSREVETIQQYVQDGGNLVVLAEHIWGPSYYSKSNFAALNQVLPVCGIEIDDQLLTSTVTIPANQQIMSVLRDIRPHPVTDAITEVVATGSTLSLSGVAEGLVFDDTGSPVIAVSHYGKGQCLVLGTAIGFNADFRLDQNDPLAANIIDWAKRRLSHRVFLPLAVRQVRE